MEGITKHVVGAGSVACWISHTWVCNAEMILLSHYCPESHLYVIIMTLVLITARECLRVFQTVFTWIHPCQLLTELTWTKSCKHLMLLRINWSGRQSLFKRGKISFLFDIFLLKFELWHIYNLDASLMSLNRKLILKAEFTLASMQDLLDLAILNHDLV